jgi:hypothetical protein
MKNKYKEIITYSEFGTRRKVMVENKYAVRNSYAFRRCHPETCCCPTDFVVVKEIKYFQLPYNTIEEFYCDVSSEKEGEKIVKELNK